MYKKVIAVILGVGLCFGTMSVNAANLDSSFITSEMSDAELDSLDGIDLDAFNAQNALFVQRGETVRRTRAIGQMLTVTHYYQDGQTWSGDIMQSAGSTIGKKGCCLTSFTMVQSWLGGTDDPGEVNSKLGNAACPFAWSTAANSYNYNLFSFEQGSFTDEYAINYIVGSLDSGYPVIVGMTKDGTDSTHFVVAYGYARENIFIHDPASNRNYVLLSQYLSNYYVHRLAVYKK